MKIITAEKQHQPVVVDILSQAFATETFVRWLYPDNDLYQHLAPTFFRVITQYPLLWKSLFIDANERAVSVWIPPNHKAGNNAERFNIHKENLAPDTYRSFLDVIEQGEQYYPSQPYWYFHMLAVTPGHQGQGYGSALLNHACTFLDSDGHPAVLETAEERSVQLYQQFGFECAGTTQSGDSPVRYIMVRQPA